jgi:hypothetical protein
MTHMPLASVRSTGTGSSARFGAPGEGGFSSWGID